MPCYDVVVIGAGVAGCCCARELARYDASVLVLEAGLDLACGATRANSGIVHAGYDPEPGSLKARYNVAGSKLYPAWAAELGFAYKRNESLVVGFDEADREALAQLLERGRANGVEGLELIDGERAHELEPTLAPEVSCALRVPSGGICDPYEVALSALENALANGAELRLDARVERIERAPEAAGGAGAAYVLHLAGGSALVARCVVNAAGIHADELHNQLSAHKLHVTPTRGEYCLYDAATEPSFTRTVFQVPTAKGKGVLVSPTVHGNLFVGPNALAQKSKDALATTREGLSEVLAGVRKTWAQASGRGVITNFAGLRAKGASHDFVIGEPQDAPGFFDIACFESPGLSSAPAVGVDIAGQVAARLGASRREDFDPHRAPTRRLRAMDEAQREQAVAEDGAWGHVLCRCEQVSEAEIVAALHGSVPVLSFDALKWRCRATMGRCHGGFCTPELVRIVARELGVAPERLEKRGHGSWMVATSRPDYVALAQKERGEDAPPASASLRAPVPGGAATPSAPAPYDVVVVGGGAAGMAAATAARAHGAERVLLVDREASLGGIMRQCVHNGFGLKRFSEELSGPEFAAREAAVLEGIEVRLRTSALELRPAAVAAGDAACPLHELSLVGAGAAKSVLARAVVLACGSRERGFGALNIAGDRPSGIYTAGTAQALINLQGCLPGKRAVILGSGDIGLIMARRMTLEGMEVEGVYELLDYPSGLRRNIVQCLDDFGIPLRLSHTVVATHGKARLEAVDIAEVDPATRTPIPGTERRVACDTLVLSVGLLPENELAREAGVVLSPVTGGALVDETLATNIPGVFACGNALHVHDLADLAAAEGDVAGASAASWSARPADSPADTASERAIPVAPGQGVRYVVPQRLSAGARATTLSFRVSAVAHDAALEVVAVVPDGTETLLKRRRVRIAVPAEMERLEVTLAEDAPAPERIEVRLAKKEGE